MPSAAFKGFAGDLHSFYSERMKELYDRQPDLAPTFANSVFACATFNFGPSVVCKPHVDKLNLAYGWCAVTALGTFDHTIGGHLVLPELKLVIQFPAGSTLFIPSAMFIHYNLPIAESEARGSFTQFSAGGIFRWIAYGHQKKSIAVAKGVAPPVWWDRSKGLFPTVPKEFVTSR